MRTSKLQRIVASSGAMSRRVAQSAVVDGRVSINGKTCHNPAIQVQCSDTVMLDGRTLVQMPPGRERLWRYFKPPGLITTHKDPDGRPIIFDALPAHLPRVVTVGRLDRDTEGLLLLTTSGSLARLLMHPSSQIEREYHACVVTGQRSITSDMIAELEGGITLQDGFTFAPMTIDKLAHGFVGDKAGSGREWMRMRLKEGKKHEVKRSWQEFGFSVSRLMRVRYGQFGLDGLHQGEVDEVDPDTVETLSRRLSA